VQQIDFAEQGEQLIDIPEEEDFFIDQFDDSDLELQETLAGPKTTSLPKTETPRQPIDREALRH
jgi:hypothetical protein